MERVMKAVKSLKGRGGFTLLEVMIALAILAVGLLSLEGLFVSSIGATATGGNMTTAVILAEQKLQELQSVETDYVHVFTEYETLDSLSADMKVAPNQVYDDNWQLHTQVKINPSGTNDTTTSCIYTRTWTVTEDAPNGLKTITVTVSWPKGTNSDRSHQISITTKKSAQTKQPGE